MNAANTEEQWEADTSPTEPPEENPVLAATSITPLWDPEQRTQLSCAQLTPDSQKLWENKCVWWIITEEHITRKLVQSPKPWTRAPSQVWHALHFIIGQGSGRKNQAMGRGVPGRRKGGTCGFIEAKEFACSKRHGGTLWRILKGGIMSLDLWAPTYLSRKMREKDWPLNSLYQKSITPMLFFPTLDRTALDETLCGPVPPGSPTLSAPLYLCPNPKVAFLLIYSTAFKISKDKWNEDMIGF